MANTQAETKSHGSYKASEMHADVEKEISRLKAQALWGWDKEIRNLKWFGLQDGMHVLEVGSGPGFITEQLLQALPNSKVTCIEIDPDLIARADPYLKSKGLEGRYEILEGDLMQMRFPDSTFDFAFARLVFQHLPDPLGAASEIFRVLKPGGKLVITDVDGGLGSIVDPPNSEADALMKRLEKAQKDKGGNRDIGRRLWRILGQAGFTNMDLEAITIHTDVVPIETIMPTEWDPGGFEPALKEGLMTEEEVEIMHKAHIEFIEANDKYMLFLALMACGEKPR